MIALGVMGEISSWVVGPSRGMFATAQRGILPKFFRKINDAGVPVPLIIVQGLVVTVWDAVLTFGGGSSNVSYFAAMALTVVIYLVGYLLFFAAYLVLIFKKKDLKRTYEVPGGLFGKVLISTAGLLVSVFALFISFIPPSALPASSSRAYLSVLVISFIMALIIPFLVYEIHDKKGKETFSDGPRHFTAVDINRAIPPMARGEHHIVESREHVLKH